MTKKLLLCCAVAALLSASGVFSGTRQEKVIGGPRGIHPYLFKAVSEKNLVETARDHQWSIQFHKNRPDTIKLIAIRIEFAVDTSVQTTGNGLFGIRSGGDKEESRYYDADTVYPYDDLPHDSLYFIRQLESVRNYFSKVSRGNLTLEFSVYPSGSGQTGYSVAETMPHYSPGGKKRKESWDEYYERKTIGLITFVRDAIIAADAAKEKSPFAMLSYDSTDGTIRDENGHKTVFLIFHAGSSYLTDGGDQGALGQDTPSDMIDAFITPEFFNYYRDTLHLDHDGVTVSSAEEEFLLDEIMMCAETSNQDGLNWGIQGIIVNQVARQLGIPDLFSTSSGISGIGAFCIMDFAGYSASKGFIPPYPSAWVRAFMGWDQVYTASLGTRTQSPYSVKALTSALDRDTGGNFSTITDTTILLVPINDHEYYLIENRQRNLSGNRELFNYDTTETDSVVIANYPFTTNIDKNVLSTSGKDASNVILRVRNNDIGLPASGVLVWHIDEYIIRDRLAYNSVNADSLYRGVRLVEADGITDLGVMFQDIFYQAAFDYGGAEDVFPHWTTVENQSKVLKIEGFGPDTRPSTRANDGGHTYLKLTIAAAGGMNRTEKNVLAKNDGYHYVTNFSDSLFTVTAEWNYLVEEWPVAAVPEQYFDPLFVDLDKSVKGNELFLLSRSGRVSLWPADISATGRYNTRPVPVNRLDLRGDTIAAADTLYYFDTLPGVVAMPSAINGTVFVPSGNHALYLYHDAPDSAAPSRTTLPLNHRPSTYVCNYRDSSWVVGCDDGRVIFGTMADTILTVRLASSSPVCALATLREDGRTIAAVQENGTISLVNESGNADTTVTLPKIAIAPFSLLSGDLDRASDSTSELIVADSRHGLWVYTRDLALAPGWTEKPADWPSYYSLDTTGTRSNYPENTAPPALADLDADGYLDIVIGGTNGLYAFNYKGAMKSKWPAFLDKRFSHWYQRGSVVSSPAVVTGKNREPLILFSSITGENVTYRFTKVTRANRDRGIIWFEQPSGAIDSITELTSLEMDTILDMSDSIIAPYVIPGGFLDAVDRNAKRPTSMVASTLQSKWPLTTGSALITSPLIGYMDDDSIPDVVAVSSAGWIYRWELGDNILPETLFWPQAGYNNGRSFAFGGKAGSVAISEKAPITFLSFPNPVRRARQVTFKYKFSAPATNVSMKIFSYTGFEVFKQTTMGPSPRNLTGSFPDWNLLTVSLDGIGPGVYRCRLEATIKGKKEHAYWKMAVIR
ncbi:MAG: hypothetical protein JW863_04155 [Chitinispirillaceae bacterium]|nr:hypothetical protein [Chitinispirillaceae bacterium]